MRSSAGPRVNWKSSLSDPVFSLAFADQATVYPLAGTMTIGRPCVRCVLLADRHLGLSEGVRTLLSSVFEVVVMVGDEPSLRESVVRLEPALAVVDLSLVHQGNLHWLSDLHAMSPGLKLIAVSVHDEAGVERAAKTAGADAFVLKRAIATDLLPAVEAVLAGRSFPS